METTCSNTFTMINDEDLDDEDLDETDEVQYDEDHSMSSSESVSTILEYININLFENQLVDGSVIEKARKLSPFQKVSTTGIPVYQKRKEINLLKSNLVCTYISAQQYGFSKTQNESFLSREFG